MEVITPAITNAGSEPLSTIHTYFLTPPSPCSQPSWLAILKSKNNGQIYIGDALLRDKSVLIKDGIISGLIDDAHIPQQANVTDCKGAFIAPGLLDLQIYGGGGYLFSANPTAESLHAIADALVAQGTTGFLITLATNSMEVFMEAVV